MFSATTISELVVFGASESDAGNVYVATGNTFPAAPYVDGRFTNGPNWVDHLADELGLERATPSILGGDNFAVGGATTGDGFSGFAPNIGVQINGSEIDEVDINGDGVPDVRIEGYLENNIPSGDELFVIQAGANDLRNNPFGDPSVPVENLVSHIRDLATAGGEHFLVRNVGRLGDEPALRILPDLAPNAGLLQQVLNGQATAFNELLAPELNALESELDITIEQFDAFGVSTPSVLESFGFTNLTDPLCFECAVGIPNASPNPVSNPEEYVFWDLVHPTTNVAEVLGKLATVTVTDRVVVNSTEDSGANMINLNDDVVTLREAVQVANLLEGQQRIEFDLGGDEHVIALQGTELLITDDVEIVGLGAHRLGVSGNGISRVFQVFNAVPGNELGVSISDLRIADGTAQSGGGLLNSGGQVTLKNVQLKNNQSVPDANGHSFGGAIYNVGPDSSLIVTNSTLDGNMATGFVAYGGAIANLFGATATISHSTLRGNHVTGFVLASGGAIDNEVGSQLTVQHSTLKDNAVQGGPQGGAGGAISNAGGSSALVTHSRLTGNRASGGDGAVGQDGGPGTGGALFNSSFTVLSAPAPATLRVTQSTLTGNAAIGGNGGTGGDGGGGVGGAILNFQEGTVVVEGSKFSRNLALGGAGQGGDGLLADGLTPGGGAGGAIANGGDPTNPAGASASDITISNSRFVGNRAEGNGSDNTDGINGGGFGGAILNQIGEVAIDKSQFIGNQAIGGDGADGLRGAIADGGAIDTFLGSLEVTRSSFKRNAARGGRGASGGDGGNGSGGAIMNSNSTTELNESRFLANVATGGKAGNGGDGGLGRGGALFNNLAVPGASILSAVDSLFALNGAQGGRAGRFGNGGDAFGGAVHSEGGTITNLERNGFLRNRATGGGAGMGGSGGDGRGGGLYVDNDAFLELVDIALTDLDTHATVVDSRFVANVARGTKTGQGIGGAVYVEGGVVRIENVIFVWNFASTSDGDVFGLLSSMNWR